MACAGVVASAGAQLDFTVMTVASRASGKSTFFGFNSSTSTGSLSNATLETQGGNARTCTQIEDQGTVNYEEVYAKIQKALKEIYWYDAKVYDIVSGGESISELSRKSQISYYSLYNTFRNVKSKLKELI